MHSDRHNTLRSYALRTAIGLSKREIDAANVYICGARFIMGALSYEMPKTRKPRSTLL
jgi:hypothetical protein